MTGTRRPAGRLLRRGAAATLLLPFMLVVAWFLAGLLGALVPSAGAAPGGEVEIRLVGTPLHYDFLLPATPQTRAAFAFARDVVPLDAPGVAWVLAGWGARDFYTRTAAFADMHAGPVWRAITGDASVLRVDAWGPFAGEGTLRLRLGADQYTRLLAAIAATRAAPDGGRPGFTPTDAFFAAEGRFDAFRTCNVWVGAMLRQAGVRFGVWTPTPQAVRLSVAIHAATS